MATMADVAARAGVSVATVSRALSGDGTRVSAEALQRVLDAAEALAYTPNNLARNMRSGTTRILGLVISDIGNPFFTAVARGAEDVAHRHGYSLVLSNTDENPEREAATLGVMAAERAAGVIIATTNENGTALRRSLDMGMAIVAIDRHILGMPTDSVVVDNESARPRGDRPPGAIGPSPDRHRRRAEGRGHRAGTPPRLRASPPGGTHPHRPGAGLRGRLPGGRRPGDDPPTARPGQPTERHLLGQQPDHDRCAGALRERGVVMPSAMSLVGFDDIPTGELLDPPLTVVQQPTYRMGAHAAELLIRRLLEPTAVIQEVVLAARLVVRGSTGPVPAPVMRS